MKDEDKTKEQLIKELVEIHQRIAKLETVESELMMVEKELKKSEERYRRLVEQTTDAIMSLDLDTNIVSWNKGAEEMFGYRSEEIIGKSQTLLVPKGFRASCQKNFWNATVDGYVKEAKTARRTKDDRVIPVEISLAAIKDDEGEHIGYVSILRDITERNKMENDLRTRIKELETFYNVAVDREIRMKELKEKIEELRAKLSQYEK